ncbi:MAG: hypothetical protein ABEJ44_06965 [Halanaeroarchaeum sp.]
MKRRRFLGSIAALSGISAGSGCLGSPGGTNDSFRTDRTVGVTDVERRPPAEPEKLDEDEKPTGLEIDVSVVETRITTADTARVVLRYTNAGRDTLELNVNPESPDPLSSEMDDPGLILVSDAYDPTRATPGCWKPVEERFPQPAVAYQYPIEPGESATLAYDVWAAPRQEADCIRPGEYQFTPLYGSFTLAVRTDRSGT